MKALKFLLLILLTIVSCEKKAENTIEQKPEIDEKAFFPKIGEKFFKI